jgi:hypothetical protein
MASSLKELKSAMSGEKAYNMMKEKISNYINENKDIIKQYDKLIKFNRTTDTYKSLGTSREIAKEDLKSIIRFYLQYIKKLDSFSIEIRSIIQFNIIEKNIKYNNRLLNLIDTIIKKIGEINKRIEHINSPTKKSFFSTCKSCFTKTTSPIEGGKRKKIQKRRKYKKM